MQTYDISHIDPDRRARIEAAERAMENLNRGMAFHDWMTVGIGVNDMEAAAMDLAGSQDLQSHAYRQAWRSLATDYPRVAEMNKAERSLASWMATNREAVESWHARLDDRKRRNINTPRAVWNNHPLGRAAREPTPVRERKRNGQAAEIDDATHRLHQTFDRLETRLGPDLAGLFDLSPNHIDASVDNFLAIFEEADVRRFIERLQARLAPAQVTQAVDETFTKSLTKPRRGIKKLDDPSRPRNRTKVRYPGL